MNKHDMFETLFQWSMAINCTLIFGIIVYLASVAGGCK